MGSDRLIQSDYHIHSSFYRIAKPGAAPGPKVIDQIRSASAVGSVKIGIVEHCNQAPHHPDSCLFELRDEFLALRLDRATRFLGVEADLLPDGEISCPKTLRRELKLDYVIASCHLNPVLEPDFHRYIAEERRRILGALRHNPDFDLIGHPFVQCARYEKAGLIPAGSGFAAIPEEWLDEIIAAAKTSGKALEINHNRFDDPAYRRFLAKLRDSGAWFSVGSDAHDTAGTRRAAERTRRLADEFGFTETWHWLPKPWSVC